MPILADGQSDWFSAGVGLASAVIGALGTLLATWFTRRRPNRVLVREVATSSLVIVHEKAREVFVTKFGEKVVTSPSQFELAITNVGQELLKDVTVVIRFPAGTTPLYVSDSVPEQWDYSEISPKTVSIKIPFLNPYRPHRDLVKVEVVCDGPITDYDAAGRGEGWSVVFRKLPPRPSRRARQVRLVSALVGTIFMAIAVTAKLLGSDTIAWVCAAAAYLALAAGIVISMRGWAARITHHLRW